MTCDDELPGLSAGVRGLLSVKEAIELLASAVAPIERSEIIPIEKAAGLTVRCNLAALRDLPPFDQSAMDGFALSGGGRRGVFTLAAHDGIRAGDGTTRILPGYARGIATGAPIPDGADRVVMLEHAALGSDRLVLRGEVTKAANIRFKGEDVREGDHLVAVGAVLDVRKIALLAAQGYRTVEVRWRPRIAILTTGNEVRQPGGPIDATSVYDANGPMLTAAAARAGLDLVQVGHCRDDVERLGEAIEAMCARADLVLVSGGSSTGEGDHTDRALRAAGGTSAKLSIAMKPGKPAVFGKLGKATVLGISGNTVAAYVSWITLGRAVVAALRGRPSTLPRSRRILAINELKRRSGRMEFAPAKISLVDGGDTLEFLGKGGSARLQPLASADGLAMVEESRGNVSAGEMVSFFPFRDAEEF